MRRLVFAGHAFACPACILVSILLLLPNTACKRKKRPPPVDSVTQTTQLSPGESLSSMIQVADPHAKIQLLKGFHEVEENSWRWTEGAFAASLRPPLGAAQKGALLVLKFAVPDVVLQKLNTIRLSASVNGVALPPEEYRKPGEYTFSREVPPTALTAPAVTAEFTLDKFLPPSPSDQRALGIIVSAIGFEAR